MKKKENIINLPNLLTLIRVILSIGLILSFLFNAELNILIIIFIIAALTDGIDGYIARIFNLKTEFGRKFDFIADRILMIVTITIIILYFNRENMLDNSSVLKFILIMSREIIAAPFALWAFIAKKRLFPQARKIAKLTTLLQGLTLPMILLDWQISLYFAILTCITGAISGILYIHDALFTQKID